MPFIERQNKPKLHYLFDDFTDPWFDASYIILQHGFGRSAKFWYRWVPYLSRFLKVVRPDLRGLGESSADFELESGLTIDAFRQDLIGILDQLGIDAVHYCGESLGGLLGIVLAAEYPERVKTLTLVSAPLNFNEGPLKALACGHASFADALNKMGSKDWAEATNSAARFPPDADPGLRRFFVEEIGKSRVEVLIALATLVPGIDVTKYLSRIKAPVLGIYPAAKSPLTNTDQEDLLLQQVRDIRIVHIASSWPTIHHLAPATCATEVLHFVSQFDGIPCREL